MKRKSYKAILEEYEERYGKIPIDQEDILVYLKDTLRLTDKDFEKIQKEEDYVQSIPWEEFQLILPIIPKPCPRPRYSSASGCFYVTGASENKKLLKHFIQEVYHIVYTQTHFTVITYLPTPISQMSKSEIYRAEKGSVADMSNPDWDNLGKTYSDMVQNILLLNDNIISAGHVYKYYSVKPRVVITIKYQRGFDSRFNKRRIMNSTNFKQAIEVGNVIEVYTEGNDLW